MKRRTFEEIKEATRKDFRIFSEEELIDMMAGLRWVAEGAGRVDQEEEPVEREVVAA